MSGRRASAISEAKRGARFVFLAWCILHGSAMAAEFRVPERLTENDPSRAYQMSRTANGVTAFDSQGTLHAVYWSGIEFTVPGTFPNFVYYRNWTAARGWNEAVAIDDSEVAGEHIGGRHPSLAVAADDTVWVAWHDHRHASGAGGGNWIDNLEIYADSKPAGGSFGATDLRLTTTDAAHNGDNGFTPKIAIGPSGRVQVTWHDFHFDRGVSDIFLKTSDPDGVFDLAQSMASMRQTDLGDRGGAPEFTVPDFAVDAWGNRHWVWAGGQDAGADLYYAESAASSDAVTVTLLGAGSTDFRDPPHLTLAPGGDLWMAYGDDAAPEGENLVLRRRRAGEPGFDPPIAIAPGASRQIMPDIEIDEFGRVHLVWIDQRAGTHVYYGLYDPVGGELVEEIRLTEDSAFWVRPTLAIGPSGAVFILFEQTFVAPVGEIWFTTNFVLNGARRDQWKRYE